jgi:plasmid maintenance system antidote protein VapI
MFEHFEKYKGIHPGAILERELGKRQLPQRRFALSIHEHPQSLNAITKGKRGMNTSLALKIEKELGWEEGVLMMLQVFYDIKVEKERQHNAVQHPNLSIIRKALFWDTDMSYIDWNKHYKYVITRVFERGNLEEKKEIQRFYGSEKIKEVIGSSTIPSATIPIMRNLKAN